MNQPSSHLLDQMREHARHAQALVEGFGKDEFFSDRRTHQAVLMSLLIMGEAAAKLIEFDPGIVTRHQDIPWRSMRGMRNRIAHDYASIDLDIVRETVRQALPRLAKALDAGLWDAGG